MEERMKMIVTITKRQSVEALRVAALGAVFASTAGVSTMAQAADFQLEEITITAQKRPETLQEVPISVATLSGDRLNAIFSSGADVLALKNQIPGLYAESSNGRGSPRFYIRGLGNVDFDLAASQPVSIVMDEVVMENVVLKSFPLFDVAQVEVIRGPQGTLFGRNTTAGIVKFDTAKPTTETKGYLKLTAGNLGTTNIETAVGGELIGGVLSGRISALSQSRDDWIDNLVTPQSDDLGGHDERAYRAQLLWMPAETFSALLSYQARELEGTASVFYGNAINTGQSGVNSNFNRDQVSFDGGNGNPQFVDASGTTLKMDWEFGNMNLVSISSYQDANSSARGDIDGTASLIPFSSDTRDSADIEQLTQELRLASNYEGAFNWQAGLFYFDSELAVISDSFGPGSVLLSSSTVLHNNEAYGVFGQVSYDLSDQLTLALGARYTEDEKDFQVLTLSQQAPISLSDDQVSWDLSVNYALTTNSSVFARLASGFRAQSIQGRNVSFGGPASTADSETIVFILFI
ncbi:hypothetical protein COB55_03460 [Candidatus Wolfebacteria bacterium]|nr:MAG: hypothetical protein COB55_03460 [Candidatus Wolfebacteria bacterium]